MTSIPEDKFSFSSLVEYSDDAVVSRPVIKKDNGNVTVFAFAKGQELSEHSTPFDALVTVLEGTGQIIIAGKAHDLGHGESIIMPADIPHAVKAVSNFKMKLIMIK